MSDIPPPPIRLPTHGEQIFHRGRVYVLGEEIGQGHFGRVYACSDRWGNDLVAKVLVPHEGSHDDVRTSWDRELNNLLILRHPNITYAYDAFEYEGTYYLIIERCGQTVGDLIRIENFDGQGWLPALSRDLLQALEFIHTAGYVHKDIHPGNVFVSWSRDRMLPEKAHVVSFKVGDLGITRLETDINVFGTMLAQWMLPPEAIAPEDFGLIGKATDIYHLGLVFLSVLLGDVPHFTREEILAGRPREMAEALPSSYASPIAWALRRHVAARPQSAADFWEGMLKAMPQHVLPR